MERKKIVKKSVKARFWERSRTPGFNNLTGYPDGRPKGREYRCKVYTVDRKLFDR